MHFKARGWRSLPGATINFFIWGQATAVICSLIRVKKIFLLSSVFNLQRRSIPLRETAAEHCAARVWVQSLKHHTGQNLPGVVKGDHEQVPDFTVILS